MKILQVHNDYQFKGGEDRVLYNEHELLKANGEEPSIFMVTNDDITTFSLRVKIALTAHYSKWGKRLMADQIAGFKPDIVHVHNFFPQLTPSIYDACIDASVPIVQTLHNYRLMCPGGLLLRDGKICEVCISKSPYNAVVQKCYRNSYIGSLSVAHMVSCYRKKRIWDKVDHFITLTNFAKNKFIEAGFPEKKLSVKPNFNSDDVLNIKSIRKKQALFVGRISQEKGISILIDAWKNIDLKLFVAGDGPLLPLLRHKENDNIILLGKQTREKVAELMRESSFLILPAISYEGFPMVIAEAFSHGLPVICSQLGGMAEIVEDGVTGLHFEAGNANDLAKKVTLMINNPEKCKLMGENAKKVYLEKYTPEKNYQMLINIYKNVLADYKGKRNE